MSLLEQCTHINREQQCPAQQCSHQGQPVRSHPGYRRRGDVCKDPVHLMIFTVIQRNLPAHKPSLADTTMLALISWTHGWGMDVAIAKKIYHSCQVLLYIKQKRSQPFLIKKSCIGEDILFTTLGNQVGVCSGVSSGCNGHRFALVENIPVLAVQHSKPCWG